MAMLLILILLTVATVLGGIYAPEIRLWIDRTAKSWQERWETAQDEIDPQIEHGDDDPVSSEDASFEEDASTGRDAQDKY